MNILKYFFAGIHALIAHRHGAFNIYTLFIFGLMNYQENGLSHLMQTEVTNIQNK